VWDIRYRPIKFSDVLGQAGNVKVLKARLSRGTAFDTSYLFMGGHGQGKTTLARILGRAMLCTNLDKNDPEPCNECESCLAVLKDQSDVYSERDAASQGNIDDIRTLVEKLGFIVGTARMRIELFDEAHRIGNGAQDVLLKPLEEKKLVGMFCTTEPNKIKGTIRTRCEEYTIRKVTREEVLKRAKHVCACEGVAAEDDALLTIIDSSGGHIRDIINKMEMISQVGDINIANTREYLHLGAVTIYYDILLSLHDPVRAIELVDQACENVSPEDVVAGIAEAAMNSFRLINGMYTEFVLVDRALGKQVFDRYGSNTVRLADYFLQNRYASRVTLMRDVLLLTQLPGNLPLEGPPQSVFLHVGGGVGATVQSSFAQTPPIVVPVTPPVQQTEGVTETHVSVPVAPTPVAVPTSSVLNGHSVQEDPRLHGFGPTSWSEPRKKSDNPNRPAFGVPTPEQDARVLQPDEWARAFLLKWPRGRND
jgi:DNA polymerase III subunit gamma/tau